METLKSYEKRRIHRSTGGNLSAESLEGVYKRHLQGAWVRSGASVFLWLFALSAYYLKAIDSFVFAGVSSTVLSLINDILDLSKIEAGKMELEVSEIGFQALLENSLVMIKEKALKHRIKLATRFMELPPTIRADERKVKQILYNLLSNAVKFTPDGGVVQLEARGMDGQGVEIVVSDNGIGLKETDLERIFHPFEQVDSSASRRYQGTGLGLSLTKRMVELHGGRIWAESEGLGRGSRLHIFFPINEKMN